MKKGLIVSVLLLAGLQFTTSCDELYYLTKQTMPMGQPITQTEIANGMRESLILGAQNAVKDLSAEGGFYKNDLLRIPFPPEAQRMETSLRNIGMGAAVDRFVETLNRSAEVATDKALGVFTTAVRQMSFNDVMDVFMGPEDAATQFLIRTTSDSLRNAFIPPVRTAIDEVELTSLWNPLVSAYNQIPFVKEVNANLEDYIVQKAMDGLFITVAREESLIRENPQARATDLLRRVFGERDRRLNEQE